MANDQERSDEQLMHDLTVANDCGERPPGRHRRESYDDLDTESGSADRTGPGDGPPDEPPPV